MRITVNPSNIEAGAPRTLREKASPGEKAGRDSAAQAKAALIARRNDLSARITSIDCRLQDYRQASCGLAGGYESLEALHRSATAARLELAQVHRALHRIEVGNYGICEYCGTRIGESLLRIIRELTRCTTCCSQ